MVSANEQQLPACRKEKEIVAMQKDIEIVKKAVMGNGGKEGLIVTVPLLSQIVRELGKSVSDLKTVVSGFLKYQQQTEAREEAMHEMNADNRDARKRSRWVIGILVTINLATLGALIATIHLLTEVG